MPPLLRVHLKFGIYKYLDTFPAITIGIDLQGYRILQYKKFITFLIDIFDSKQEIPQKSLQVIEYYFSFNIFGFE